MIINTSINIQNIQEELSKILEQTQCLKPEEQILASYKMQKNLKGFKEQLKQVEEKCHHIFQTTQNLSQEDEEPLLKEIYETYRAQEIIQNIEKNTTIAHKAIKLANKIDTLFKNNQLSKDPKTIQEQILSLMKEPLVNTGNHTALAKLKDKLENSFSSHEIIEKQNGLYDTSLLIDEFKEFEKKRDSLEPEKAFKKCVSLHEKIKKHLQNAPLLDFTSDEEALESALKKLEESMQNCILQQKQKEEELTKKNVSLEPFLDISTINSDDKPKLLEALNEILTKKQSIKRNLPLTLLGQDFKDWPGTQEEKLEAFNTAFPLKQLSSIAVESKLKEMEMKLEKIKEMSKHPNESACNNHNNTSPIPVRKEAQNDLTIEEESIDMLFSIDSLLDLDFQEAMIQFSCLASKEHKAFFLLDQREWQITYRPPLHLYAIHKQTKPNEVNNVNEPRMYGQNAMFNIGNCKASNQEIKCALQRTIIELALQSLAKTIEIKEDGIFFIETLEKIQIDGLDPNNQTTVASALYKKIEELQQKQFLLNQSFINPYAEEFEGQFGSMVFHNFIDACDAQIKSLAVTELLQDLKNVWKMN